MLLYRLKKLIYTVCNGKQTVVKIEFVVRNDPHIDGDIGESVEFSK